jgi:hypothetical protein
MDYVNNSTDRRDGRETIDESFIKSSFSSGGDDQQALLAVSLTHVCIQLNAGESQHAACRPDVAA